MREPVARKCRVIGREIAQNTSFVPFRGWREPQAGRLFLCAGVGGGAARPRRSGRQPLALPRPRRGRGTGGGRGEGCGRKRQGKKDQAADRPGAEQARAPTRRRRGRRSTAPEERPKGRRGGNGGPRPLWGAGPPGGRQRLPQAPRSGPRAAPPGARAGGSGPPPTAGAAHAPHLVRPGADPRRGRARGKRGAERGPGRREPPQGGPAAAAPRRPAARSTIHKGRRPAQKESAQAVAWALSGKENSWQSQPLAGLSYHSGGAAVKPPKGAAPYLILGHYSVRGAP